MKNPNPVSNPDIPMIPCDPSLATHAKVGDAVWECDDQDLFHYQGAALFGESLRDMKATFERPLPPPDERGWDAWDGFWGKDAGLRERQPGWLWENIGVPNRWVWVDHCSWADDVFYAIPKLPLQPVQPEVPAGVAKTEPIPTHPTPVQEPVRAIVFHAAIGGGSSIVKLPTFKPGDDVVILPDDGTWEWRRKEQAESVRRGIEDAACGRLHDMGSFAQYLEPGESRRYIDKPQPSPHPKYSPTCGIAKAAKYTSGIDGSHTTLITLPESIELDTEIEWRVRGEAWPGEHEAIVDVVGPSAYRAVLHVSEKLKVGDKVMVRKVEG